MTNTKLKKYILWYDWRGQETFREYKFHTDYDALQYAHQDPIIFRVDDRDGITLWTRNHAAT